MISIRRISLGGGWRYLIESVARGDGAPGHFSDLTAYYAASGTPPGRFLGSGLAGLGGGTGVRPGAQVSEEHLRRMLGGLADPVTGQPAGRVMTAPAGKAPVAGFDLTFSVAKSVSVAWALTDEGTKDVIYRCHRQAVAYVLGWAETHVLRSRSGTNGIIEEDITGAVAAAFTHWASRADDPQLHDHVVVWNRGKSASDGLWRTLDSRALFKATVTLSEMHQGVLADLLTAALGVGWDTRTRRSGRPRYEVNGVPEQLMAEFSQRAQQITEHKDQLVAEFAATHGRPPTAVEVIRLRQQATLATRPAKTYHSLDELTTSWRARANQLVPQPSQVAWVASLAGRNDLPPLRNVDIGERHVADAAAAVTEFVASRHATFTRMNLLAEAHRVLQGVVFASPDDRVAVAERITALAAEWSVPLTSQGLRTPAKYLRGDGSSRLAPQSRAIYTSAALIEAEARLLTAGRDTSGPACKPATAARLLAAPLPHTRVRLSPGQARAVETIATSGRVLDVLVGPAGTGKTTTMAGLAGVWEATHGPGSVTGLAASATAAGILGQELEITAENTAKWLTEWRRVPELAARRDALTASLARQDPSSAAAAILRHRLRAAEDAVSERRPRPGQLIIVDEASMVGTFALDELVTAAAVAGAKVLLAGDPAQLPAIDAGGALGLLAADQGTHVAQLGEVRRFCEGWERRASLELRAGDPAALGQYAAHGRITGGNREEMIQAVYDGWRADTAAGKASLMIAGPVVAGDLNRRAHDDLVAAGQVSAGGMTVADGLTAAVGDVVVTRLNDRRLTTSRAAWVKNGDRWIVTATGHDGSMTVRRENGRGHVVLPAPYVSAHVQLGYAITPHRSQGATVATAHALIDPATSREALYEAVTRGRESNRLYVDTRYDPDPATSHGDLTGKQDPLAVLAAVLARDPTEISAHQMMARAQRHQESFTTLASEYATIAADAQAARWDQLVSQCGLSASQLEQARSSPAYGPLLAALRDADAAGFGVDAALPRLAAARDLGDAEDVAAVLHERVDQWAHHSTPRPRSGAGYIAGLIPRATKVTDPDLAAALSERDQAMTARAVKLAHAALTRGDAWITRLGPPPTTKAARSRWLDSAATVAAYRERWCAGDDPRPLGDSALARTTEAATQQTRASAAAQRARALAGRARPADHTEAAGATVSPVMEEGIL